jgi:hypothetical protein
MSGKFLDLLGSTKALIQIGGRLGVSLKNSAGNLLVRNAADSADADITVDKLFVSGEEIELNSDAAGSGADWKLILKRAIAGMTADVTLTLPPTDGTPGQVLGTDGSGNLDWVSAGATGLAVKMDTTTLGFGSSSPLALFSTGAADIVDHVDIIIDTPFDGTANVSIGTAGDADKYGAATQFDLGAPAETCFTVYPNLPAAGVEALIATYAAGGATVGSARVIVHYGTPA